MKTDKRNKWYKEHLKELDNKHKKFLNFKLYQLTFKMPVISYLQQTEVKVDAVKESTFDYETLKDNKKKCIKLFVEYTKSQGMSFDAYIDKWTNKLLKQHGDKVNDK